MTPRIAHYWTDSALRPEIGVKTSQGKLLGNYGNLKKVWIRKHLDLGVDRFMLSFPEAATDLSGLKLFAEEVMPDFK